MPWSLSELPASAKSLSKKQKEVFVAAANAALSDGNDEGVSIAIGIAAAKKHKESMKKSLIDVDEVVALIKKHFSGSQREDVVKAEVVDEEMVSYEVVYEPFTKDAHDQWMSDETIEKACENFNANLKKGVVQPNLFHVKNTDLFSVEDTWIQKELDVEVVQTGELIKAGTWVAKIKYHDPVLWQLKKSNVIGGVSIGGRGVVDHSTGEITDVTFDEE